jgi:hypothetical protein
MLVKIRMNGNNSISNKPNIGHCYNLVYIKGNNLAEYLGNESTGSYYIYDDNDMMGSEKGGGMEKFINEQLKEQINEVDFTKVTKVGLFEVKKIWENKVVFSVHGTPIFNENIIYDFQTNIWQNKLDNLIKKCKWTDYIIEEINMFYEKKNILINDSDIYIQCQYLDKTQVKLLGAK